MTTKRQKTPARSGKTHSTRRTTPSYARTRAQPEGRQRAKPGATGEGELYHIEVRPKAGFVTFRTQDVGKPGGIERVAGKRPSGSWATQKWLISKTLAHIERGRLAPDASEAKEVLEELGSKPSHISGDRFKAKPRSNVPEDEKPTAAERRAQLRDIVHAIGPAK